jgi:hypothetical protein
MDLIGFENIKIGCLEFYNELQKDYKAVPIEEVMNYHRKMNAIQNRIKKYTRLEVNQSGRD